MRKPEEDVSVFAKRRAEIAKHMEGGALILPSHPNHVRNNDVYHPYRQDTNLYYMTGFEEPGSIFVFRPGQDPETVMFVRRKDKERETWDGFRYGIEGVKKHYGIDAAYPIDEFERVAPDLLLDVTQVFYTLFNDYEFDARFARVLSRVKMLRGRSGKGILPIEDSYPLIGEMRLRKSDHEIDLMRKACAMTSQAHLEVMKATRPGVNERALYGTFLKEIMVGGSAREAYPAIVASGANATTLHYIFNDQTCQEGDLLLIDAGAEYRYYAADITRTYPVSGKFSGLQKSLYSGVLEIQKKIVASIRPGIPFKQVQEWARDMLVDLMLEQGLLVGPRDQFIEDGAYRRYYPHNVSHFLGLDVHDAGLTEINGKSRLLEPGMVITIEPGIYIAADDSRAPAPFRGTGIRIEDNVVVTESGNEVLSAATPKEVSELEEIVGSGPSL